MKKILKIGGIVAGSVVAVIAIIIAIYARVPAPTTHASGFMPVPQFGINMGDYSSCLNKYHPDDILGDQSSGNWTPPGGGIQTGVAAIYSNGTTGAGDCIQASIVTSTDNTYSEDFRVGIRIGAGLANGTAPSANSTNGVDCAWGSNWQYTPWASQGGGTSPSAPVPGYDNWGAECVQLIVETAPLPPGIVVENPTFGTTIYSGGGQATSQTASPCYLNSQFANWDPNAPQPSCFMPNVGASGFFSENITLTTQVKGVSLTNNLPSQLVAGQSSATSTITVNNIATVPITSNSITEKDLGPGSGNCTVDTNGDGIADAVAAGGPPDPNDPNAVPDPVSCSIQIDASANDLYFTHTGTFTTPATVPAVLKNVTKITTARDGYVEEVGVGCDSLNLNDSPAKSIMSFLVPKAEAIQAGGCTTVRHQQTYSTSYNGATSLGIAPGSSAVFSINPLKAPNASGTYNETWILSDASGPVPGGELDKTIQVGPTAIPLPSVTGTITIISRNAKNQTGLPATWDLMGPTPVPTSLDVCATLNLQCTGSRQVYTGLSANDDIYFVPTSSVALLPGTNSNQYALKSVTPMPIAENTKKSPIDAMLAFAQAGLANVAHAETVYPGPVQTLTPPAGGNNNATFIILWEPIAVMDVSPATVLIDAPTSTTGSATISNTGAPGSVLQLQGDDINYVDGNGWLSVSGDSGSVSGGNSTNVTLNANTGGLPSGIYEADVTFKGTDPATAALYKQTITVYLTIGSSIPPPPPPPAPGTIVIVDPTIATTTTVIYTPTPPVNPPPPGTIVIVDPKIPEPTTIIYEPPGLPPEIPPTATSTPIAADPTSPTTIVIDPTIATTTIVIYSPTAPVNPPPPGTVVVVDPSIPETTVVIYQPPVAPPVNPLDSSCSVFKASPSSIIVPATSQISYNCINVTTCILSGGKFGSGASIPVVGTTANGSVSVAPLVNTIYSMSCQNQATGENTNSSLQITVTNPGRIETNP